MTNVLKFYSRICLFLFPILFLPIVTDVFGFGKNFIVMASAVVGMLLWVVAVVIDKKLELKTNKIITILGLLCVWAWIGWFKLGLGVKMRSVMDIGGVGTITAMLTWAWLWLQIKDENEEQQHLNWLTAAGLVVTVSSLIVFLIPASKMPLIWPKTNPLVSIDLSWSMTGSLMGEAVLLLFLAMEWGKRLLEKLKKEDVMDYIGEAVMTGILTLAVLLDIYRIYKTGWVVIDRNSAWVIAVEAFKRNPIWGVGAGNFIEAFNRFRPDTYNLTKFWSSGFKLSSMGILQVWTELGVVGMGILTLMGLRVLGLKKDYAWFRLVVMVAVVAFLPINLVSIILLVWSLIMVGREVKNLNFRLKIEENSIDMAKIGVGVVMVGVSVFGGYWLVRILLGDVYLRQSLVAASKNNGGDTYNLQIKTIGMNGYLPEYRRIYSQTNLALATSILSNKELTDDDKQKASTLIQQSVREAKAAISLDQMNANYWTNLAVIYRQLVGVIDGSADWSFQAYQQAAMVDPSNPLIKLDLGGLLYSANRFDDADRVFEQMVTAKPDFANAWYNWAFTAKQNGRLADAVNRMTQALTLVPVDSGDYAKASKDLETWKKELDKAIAAQKAALVTPTPTPTPESLRTAEPLPTTNAKSKVAVPNGELAPPEGQPTAEPTKKI